MSPPILRLNGPIAFSRIPSLVRFLFDPSSDEEAEVQRHSGTFCPCAVRSPHPAWWLQNDRVPKELACRAELDFSTHVVSTAERYLRDFFSVMLQSATSPLHIDKVALTLSKHTVCEFSPFFKKGVFDYSSHGTGGWLSCDGNFDLWRVRGSESSEALAVETRDLPRPSEVQLGVQTPVGSEPEREQTAGATPNPTGVESCFQAPRGAVISCSSKRPERRAKGRFVTRGPQTSQMRQMPTCVCGTWKKGDSWVSRKSGDGKRQPDGPNLGDHHGTLEREVRPSHDVLLRCPGLGSDAAAGKLRVSRYNFISVDGNSSGVIPRIQEQAKIDSPLHNEKPRFPTG
ncbi:hypothetical protein J1605_003131 [Eschrichtius robustus]|uniref:Uncharacterized protein n=1 Tax=Eschrichtius robustus TaxID=9764 RepID=A0AB34HSF0_ESCRO|nr:hypothetical protein J1605_003131 [Eschrichtius robustus]